MACEVNSEHDAPSTAGTSHSGDAEDIPKWPADLPRWGAGQRGCGGAAAALRRPPAAMAASHQQRLVQAVGSGVDPEVAIIPLAVPGWSKWARVQPH